MNWPLYIGSPLWFSNCWEGRTDWSTTLSISAVAAQNKLTKLTDDYAIQNNVLPRPGLLNRLKDKAIDVSKRTRRSRTTLWCPMPGEQRPSHRFCQERTYIAHASGPKIGDTVKTTNCKERINSIICSTATGARQSQSSQRMEKRLYKHKDDLHHYRTSNSLVAAWSVAKVS
ncbi:hypothetical protein GWK47_049252 [Chionoecetes opilio]|uniref:Uncharacterized protein n=1 Tax=Chionoecetes opilio TaxID=41210 RepID=A0A8J4Y3R1_CHIOP|nr:hypothetical protein GWK47_049252 [Chionoecetes opilio]